jgi:hypothetical protein
MFYCCSQIDPTLNPGLVLQADLETPGWRLAESKKP